MEEKSKLSVEECKPLLFDNSKLLEPSRKLFRINNYKNGRYYYAYDNDGNPKFYISITNAIDQTMPTSPYLIEWIAQKGLVEAERYKDERADYGTLMHAAFTNLLIDGELNLDELGEIVENYCKEKGRLSKAEDWTEELKSDVLAFAQWVIDYKVKPVFIELVMASDEDLTAGALDLGCYLTIEEKDVYGEVYKTGPRKGQPKETKMMKEVFAIVDYKSGKKGFYENNEIQLQGYKRIALENFPQLKKEEIKLFNFSPKDWRTAPTYNFKDQTESKSKEKLDLMIGLSKIQHKNREKTVIVKSGIIDFSKEEKSIEKNYQNVDFSEYLKNKDKEEKEKVEDLKTK